MLWCDFYHKLKKIDRRFWVHIFDDAHHPEYPWIKICGIHYGSEHICAVTFDSVVPMESDHDERGVLTHQGLIHVLRKISRHRRREGSVTAPISTKKVLAKSFGISPHLL